MHFYIFARDTLIFFPSQKVRHRFLRMFCIIDIANKRYGAVYTAVALQFNTIGVARRVDAEAFAELPSGYYSSRDCRCY